MGYLNTTWRHLRRSPYQAIAAVFIITQTFFVITLFTFLIAGSAKIINYFESVPQVSIFFKNEAKPDDITTIQEQLKATGKVAKMRYVTKSDALRIYQEKFRDEPLLLEFVSEDILPASLDVSANQLDDLVAIADMVKGSPVVRDVVFQKDVVARLISWTDAMRKIGIALIVILALDSIFIMVIIIGIRISQRKEEIEIMRLLGATTWYIRWPFILEGMFYGIVGSLVGWFFASLALWYATPFLANFLRGIPIFPVSPIFLLEVLGSELLLAMILGMFASALAVLRYLK